MEQCSVIRSGTAEEIRELGNCFVLAVDLGFAKSKKRSCGLAWQNGRSGQLQPEQPKLCCFGECIDEVWRLLKPHHEAVLIVEAPLSGLFDKGGNPIGRGPFEKKDPTSSSRGPRYWYSGPGAAMCLAAGFFLRELIRRLRETSGETSANKVVLYEGFVTFKSETTDHSADAQNLVKSFFRTPCPVASVEAPSDSLALSILDVIGYTHAEPATPTIIVPRRNRAKDTSGPANHESSLDV